MFPMNLVLNLPEWYRLERETEKTIGKLTTLKELDYYLHNSDEYLRRLAVLRLSVLKPRDCENTLREMLEDQNENNENKELAAWVLKAAALKWNIEIFINNRYLTKFTGNEEFSDLYKITYNELEPSIRFNFSSNQVYAQIPSTVDNLSCVRNTAFNTGFDYKQWYSAFTGIMLVGLKSTLLIILKMLLRALKGTLHYIFINLPGMLYKNILQKKSDNYSYYSKLSSRTYNNQDLMPLVMKSRKTYDYKTPVFSSIALVIKKVVFKMLYVFFYPVRLFLKHKLALVYILLATYVFVNFTNSGSILFMEYTGKNFLQIQMKAANAVKQFSITAWGDFKDFTGLDDILKKIKSKTNKGDESNPTNVERYLVTAAKGLNIRKAPGSTSEKITGGSLAFGSIVTFLDKIVTDSSGSIWYYIKAEDGRSGWVSAKYLTTEKEG